MTSAVKLAYLSGRRWRPSTGLDLTAMTEFKRAGNRQAVEIKFTDRLKALEKLMELIRENRETEAEELLRTLGRTAEEPEWELVLPQTAAGADLVARGVSPLGEERHHLRRRGAQR